jgi:hypothetical protein
VPKPHLQGFEMTKIGLKLAYKKRPIFQNITTKNFKKTKKIYTTSNNIVTIIVLKNEAHI